MSAPQYSPDASQKLARVERLRQIVVRADLETDDPVDLLAHRGQHDHRQLGARAQVAAERKAVFAREHEVEHDQVDPPVGEHLAHFLAVTRRQDAKAVLREKSCQEVADLAVVVDDEQLRLPLHGAKSTADDRALPADRVAKCGCAALGNSSSRKSRSRATVPARTASARDTSRLLSASHASAIAAIRRSVTWALSNEVLDRLQSKFHPRFRTTGDASRSGILRPAMTRRRPSGIAGCDGSAIRRRTRDCSFGCKRLRGCGVSLPAAESSTAASVPASCASRSPTSPPSKKSL